MSPVLEVLIPVWVIAAFPAAVLIGRHLGRRSSGDLEALIDVTREPPS